MNMELKKYECIVCGLIYDEALGWPEDGIEPGTNEKLPTRWDGVEYKNKKMSLNN